MEDASRLFGTGLTYFYDLLAIELRNIEALGLAQQKMFEGMGVLAQRQAENFNTDPNGCWNWWGYATTRCS